MQNNIYCLKDIHDYSVEYLKNVHVLFSAHTTKNTRLQVLKQEQNRYVFYMIL